MACKTLESEMILKVSYLVLPPDLNINKNTKESIIEICEKVRNLALEFS